MSITSNQTHMKDDSADRFVLMSAGRTRSTPIWKTLIVSYRDLYSVYVIWFTTFRPKTCARRTRQRQAAIPVESMELSCVARSFRGPYSLNSRVESDLPAISRTYVLVGMNIIRFYLMVIKNAETHLTQNV